MEPEVVDEPEGARFTIAVDGHVAGFTQYRRRNATLALLHTEIEPAYEGQGLASALARGVLASARAEGVEVLPFCPFFRAYLQRHAEDVELVPAPRRTAFGLRSHT